MANAMARILKPLYNNKLWKNKFLLIIRGSVVQVHLGPLKKAENRKISAFFYFCNFQTHPNSSLFLPFWARFGHDLKSKK